MARPIIEVRQVSKRYQLGGIGLTSLRAEVERWWRRGAKGAAADEFWALYDVSFEVQPGEVIGIIGRNGAGKSTLLKIMSEITEPTSGEIRLRGRTASLLEVGTGFHPELSGRENVFLNGAILGMRRAEIATKFDAIVAFAEIEKFIDTPVKRYSSGMYVRLAFAVAAHLDPEILIIDEVLAVGDQAFQQKCLGKMQDVAREEGRTVLFVSHNMAAVSQLCARAVHLEGGRVFSIGPAAEVVQRYLGDRTSAVGEWLRPAPPEPHRKVAFLHAAVREAGGGAPGVVSFSDPLRIEMHCAERAVTASWLLRVSIYDVHGHHLLSSWDTEESRVRAPRPGHTLRAVCTFPGGLLRPGRYRVGFSACEVAGGEPVVLYDDCESAFVFEVSPVGCSGRAPGGLVTPSAAWMFDWSQDSEFPCVGRGAKPVAP